MKQFTLLLNFAVVTIAVSQNFRYGLPSEHFFTPFSLHHSSFTLLPSIQYRIDSRGDLFESKNYETVNPSELVGALMKEGTNKNYLSYNLQVSAFQYHRKTKKGEISFGLGIKSAGLLTSRIKLPSLPDRFDSSSFNFRMASPDIRVRVNAYAAVAYSVSFLKNLHRKHLQNYGLKLELLTGLNAIKANFSSTQVQLKDTNNIHLFIERKGYIARSKSKLFPEELLPFFRNPGIGIGYGMKWQLSASNKLSFNMTDFGFIYFSRTKNYLHQWRDTLNLKHENPFREYSDSLKAYSNDHNEAFYFLPFNLNSIFEHQFNNKHSLIFIVNCNPILKNSRLSLILNKTILKTHILPSLHLINFNQISSGFGISKNAKYFSWGINIDYLSGTLDLYKNAWRQNIITYNRNNFQTSLQIHYNLIKRTTRLNSKNHKLVKTFVRN